MLSCLFHSAESQEVIDAELSARVLRLVNVADSGLHSQVNQQNVCYLQSYCFQLYIKLKPEK